MPAGKVDGQSALQQSCTDIDLHLCTLTYVLAAPLRIVSDLMRTMGLTTGES